MTSAVRYLSGITVVARNLRQTGQAFIVFAWRDRAEYTIPTEEIARERLRQAIATPTGVAGEGSAA
jgi:hypothetical protein